MSKIKPLSAKDVKQVITFPEAVIESFNELIQKKFDGRQAVIKQKDVVEIILSKMPEGTKSQDLIDNHWLDVEDVYRKAGWQVEFDKPAYYETYDASFTFTKKNKIKRVVNARLEIG